MFRRFVLPPSSGRWVSLAQKDSWLYRSPSGLSWPVGNGWDGLCRSWSWKPLIHSKYIETPRPRSNLSQLSFSGQLRLPLGPSLLPDHLLASSRFPPRPCKGPNSILSHTHTIPLSPFYYGPPTHLPLAHFLTYSYPFPIGQPSPLGLI
jgi:hypothetical protein